MRRIVSITLGLLFAGTAIASPAGRPLRELVVTATRTADQVFRGASPSGSGQVAYSTGADSASWGSPATAGLAPSSSTAASGQPLCGTGSGTAAFEAPATCGLAVSSNTPTAGGNVLCATSSSAASYQSPASCSLVDLGSAQTITGAKTLSSSGSTTSAPSTFGWGTISSGQASRLLFDANYTGMQYSSGDRWQFFTYHGIQIYGARGSNSAVTYSAGSGTSDYALEVIPGGSNALAVDGNIRLGSSGTNISASYRITASSLGTVSAQSCGDTGAQTMAGVATGADCITGGPTTSQNLIVTCYASASGQVKFHLCNPTTSSITESGTWSCRCFNP